MKKLNSLVWPAIAQEVVKIIGESRNRVLVVEAAVLLTAGWEKNCHEVRTDSETGWCHHYPSTSL
jgi:dephospho-CoA kinase